MKGYAVQTLLLLALLLVIGLLGRHWQQGRVWLAERHQVALEQQIPARFADWQLVPGGAVVEGSGEARQALASLYEQQIARVYRAADGSEVMLSLVYGRDQSSDLSQAHRPEICYVAQGFQIEGREPITLSPLGQALPATRLLTRQGSRVEPLTYWMVVGDKVVRPGLERKWAQLGFALRKEIPDGVLLRVSSLDERGEHAFALQQRFLTALLAAVDPATRRLLAGAGA